MSNVPTYELKRSRRARGLRITVHAGGRVVVTAPLRTPQFFIDRFLTKKADWITKTVARQSKRKPSALPPASSVEFKKYKTQAYTFVTERIEQLNKHYGFRFGEIKIRNQKNLWGSCSKAGDLNFNYRIIFLPPQLRDYIIVHELCHLKEMNHSQKFWALVHSAIPDPKKVRQEFKRDGFTLS